MFHERRKERKKNWDVLTMIKKKKNQKDESKNYKNTIENETEF